MKVVMAGFMGSGLLWLMPNGYAGGLLQLIITMTTLYIQWQIAKLKQGGKNGNS